VFYSIYRREEGGGGERFVCLTLFLWLFLSALSRTNGNIGYEKFQGKILLREEFLEILKSKIRVLGDCVNPENEGDGSAQSFAPVHGAGAGASLSADYAHGVTKLKPLRPYLPKISVQDVCQRPLTLDTLFRCYGDHGTTYENTA
jgi:hypothetical protein